VPRNRGQHDSGFAFEAADLDHCACRRRACRGHAQEARFSLSEEAGKAAGDAPGAVEDRF